MNQAATNIQYSLNTMVNATVYGVPIITVGLIGLTSMVLAYVTIAETNEGGESTTNSMIPQSMNPLAQSEPSTNNAPVQFTGGKTTKRHKSKHRKTKSAKK
jgi:hypothetical protein